MEQNKTAEAFKLGYEKGRKVGMEGEKYPDGVDWHIVGTSCGCTSETLPVADNAGEDINLYELMRELRQETYKNPCNVCGEHTKVFYEDGNMASKKEGWKPKNERD